MAFPSSPSADQIHEEAGRFWGYDASAGIWRKYPNEGVTYIDRWTCRRNGSASQNTSARTTLQVPINTNRQIISIYLTIYANQDSLDYNAGYIKLGYVFYNAAGQGVVTDYWNMYMWDMVNTSNYPAQCFSYNIGTLNKGIITRAELQTVGGAVESNAGDTPYVAEGIIMASY